MSNDGSVTRLIAELEVGRISQAQEEIWRRYFRRLVALARMKLGDIPKAAADEEDIAIIALNSFFAGVADGRFPRLHDRDDLWRLLAKITAHKVVDQQRQTLAKKRGGGNVRGDSAIVGRGKLGVGESPGLADDELGPEALAIISDQCTRLLSLLEDHQLKLIARRRLEGHTNAEIADELGIIERTVERRLQLIRSIWDEELNKPGRQ